MISALKDVTPCHLDVTTVRFQRQSNLDYAPTYSDRERLGAVLRSELVYQMLHVNLDGLLGDKKSFPNITVAIASGDLLEDFDLAWCESRVAKVVDDMC